jgi:hypothetical protein
MASFTFVNGRKLLLTGVMNLASDTIKLALLQGTLAATAATTMTSLANATASATEAVGTGYSAGGTTVTGATCGSDGTNNDAYFWSNPAAWATATISAVAGVLYDASQGDALIGYLDFAGTKASTAGNFTVTPAATASGGWLKSA